MTPLTEDGRPLTDEERQTIRRVFASDEHGRGICYPCGHTRRLRPNALCAVCWSQQSPFWRMVLVRSALLTRAELVMALRDPSATLARLGLLHA